MKKGNKWLLLGLLALAQFMVILDVSVVNVALPAIQKALNFSATNLQWMITAYTLCFGGFLLFGGRAADLFGRKMTFLGGVAGFTIASLLVGLAQSETQIIVLRGLQGLAAAFMSPAALSIVLNTFTEGNERNKALGVWGGVAAGGAAAGVLFGGILTQYLNWRWNFFINVPIGLFVLVAGLQLIPTYKRVKVKSLDLPGAVLVTSGLMVLVYALSKAPHWGWLSTNTLVFLATSFVLLISFIFNESRTKQPLMPLSIFRIRNVRGANLTQMPITATMYSMFFFLSLYIQNILGYSPVKSGLCFLPVTFVIGIVASQAPAFIGRFGYKLPLLISPVLMGTGLLWLGRIPVDGSYLVDVFPGLVIIAAGMGLSFIALTLAATSGVPKDESGLASGLLNTSQQIGGAVGLAVLSGIASSKIAAELAAGTAMSHLPPTPELIAKATVAAYHNAFHVGIGFALLSLVLAATLIQHKRDKNEGKVEPVIAAH